MGFFNGLIMSIVALGIAGLLFVTIKNKPDLFAKENLSKSFFTMGVLALILIGAIGMVVVLLRG